MWNKIRIRNENTIPLEIGDWFLLSNVFSVNPITKKSTGIPQIFCMTELPDIGEHYTEYRTFPFIILAPSPYQTCSNDATEDSKMMLPKGDPAEVYEAFWNQRKSRA